ncbi:MAG: TVP38/TMEM64 family protein [Anaeroplasmataceae bacterium]
MKNKKAIIRFILLTIVVIIMITLTILAIPYVRKLKNVEYRNEFISKMQSMGIKGGLLLILIGAAQVILAFIPGEIIEIISGIMYGPWMGLLICEIAVTLGSIIVYYLTKFLGKGFTDCLIDTSKYENKFKVLKDPKRVEVLMASYLLFPGLPKDFLAFVAPFTSISLPRFLFINAVARIPSIISSTYFGDSLFSGHFKIALVIYIIEGVLAILGFVFNKQITNLFEKKNT